ncbi:MAG TPA: hypothetical protein VFH88_07035, partial [Candidatus Krumholzibacteria bacterium]|nr:hypothetical protein [Candidatus Krumholzibacteria bacterium]
MRRFLTGLSLLIVAIAARPSHAQTISWVSLPADVGSGLQTPAVRARLSTSQHGGVTVRVESAEPALALISADELTPGATFVDIFVPNGSTDAIFYVQAFEDTVGTVHLTATATGFATAADSIDVVTPSQRVQYLNASQDPYDPDDAFQIQVGLANVGNTGLSTLQKVRVGGPGLTATITNSDGGVGQLVTTALTGQVVTVSIAPGDNASPATVAAGGVAFDGLAAGTTDVSASIPGFLPLNIDPLQITVTAPVVSFSSSVNVGAGLQENSMLVRLSGSQHGGTTVHLESTDSTLVLFANGINDAGTSTLDVFFPNGTTNQSFYVQALEGVLGSVTVVGTASGFGLGTTNVNVVQPYFRLNGLLTTIDTLDPNDAFYVSVGIPNAPLTALSLVQEARGGGPGIAFTVTSSNDAVGLLETTSTLDDSALVVINPGQGSSPISVATGGVAFDGISAGVSTVTASATGFLPVSSGIVDVTVTQPTINITNAPAIGLGAGLQTISPMYAQLSASQHGGVIVHVEVADTTLALVAPSATSVGGKFADIPLANGQTLAAFYLQGKENTTGVISLTASAPGFTDELKDVDLVQPVVRITTTLAATHTTLDPPDPFTTQVGVANTLNFYPESVRWGAPSLTVTLSLDDSLIAELLTLPDTSNVVTVAIAPGQNVSPTSVNAGGVAFRGLSAGVVTVTATTPGFISNAKWSEIAVTVTAPAINLSTLSVVGAGLESTARTGSLGTTSHGGVTVHV